MLWQVFRNGRKAIKCFKFILNPFVIPAQSQIRFGNVFFILLDPNSGVLLKYGMDPDSKHGVGGRGGGFLSSKHFDGSREKAEGRK